jgi:hypothetical protein
MEDKMNILSDLSICVICIGYFKFKWTSDPISAMISKNILCPWRAHGPVGCHGTWRAITRKCSCQYFPNPTAQCLVQDECSVESSHYNPTFGSKWLLLHFSLGSGVIRNRSNETDMTNRYVRICSSSRCIIINVIVKSMVRREKSDWFGLEKDSWQSKIKISSWIKVMTSQGRCLRKSKHIEHSFRTGHVPHYLEIFSCGWMWGLGSMQSWEGMLL